MFRSMAPFTNVVCPECGEETRVKREFGPYTLVRRHAVGGMSMVFVAHDHTLDREVALKILSEEFSADERRIAAFEEEARITASFSHPNVVRVLTTGRAFDRFYIAMEMVPGGHFEHQIRERGKNPGAGNAAARHRGGAGTQGRARRRADPPRREARQHPAGCRGTRQAGGLRARPGDPGRQGAAPRNSGPRPTTSRRKRSRAARRISARTSMPSGRRCITRSRASRPAARSRWPPMCCARPRKRCCRSARWIHRFPTTPAGSSTGRWPMIRQARFDSYDELIASLRSALDHLISGSEETPAPEKSRLGWIVPVAAGMALVAAAALATWFANRPEPEPVSVAPPPVAPLPAPDEVDHPAEITRSYRTARAALEAGDFQIRGTGTRRVA